MNEPQITEETVHPQPLIGVFAELDPFADDREIVAFCDLENPEHCEACE